MGEIVKTAVTRTVTISDLSPSEVASIFAAWTDYEQAAFFDALFDEAADWPHGGWAMQACHFVPKLGSKGKKVLQTFSDYL